MLSFSNWDSSFFNIVYDMKDGAFDPMVDNVTEDVISMDISEEAGKLMSGSLTLRETRDHLYSSILKMGRSLTITWGYKKPNVSVENTLAKTLNPDMIVNDLMRSRTIVARVTSPSGGSSETGEIQYNCNFMQVYGNPLLTTPTKKNQVINYGTKGTAVRKILMDMGINKMFVKFRRENETVKPDTAIMQVGRSQFFWLNQLSREWRCMFRIAFDNVLKQPVVLFCNYDDDVMIRAFIQSTTGAKGIYNVYEYMTGSCNVKSYTWNQQVSESTGDNVYMSLGADGTPHITRYRADTQSVKVYKLNAANIAADMKKQAQTNSLAEFTMELLKEEDMDVLVKKKYFTVATQTTAPQGLGFQLNLECLGDPFIIVPSRAKFVSGFPDVFTTSDGLIFYANKVTHKINNQGYFCSVSIADAFTFSGGSMVS